GEGASERPRRTPRPASPGTPRKGPPPPSAGRAPTGPGEDRLRDIYQQYVAARKRNNERTDNVRYETLEKNIRAMVPKLQQKHEGKAIDFEIVVQNGRVGLKPVPK
ncbi:MAG: MXAN_5187 C-terminal domain-containing protein, partial [Myxococcota bacterium]